MRSGGHRLGWGLSLAAVAAAAAVSSGSAAAAQRAQLVKLYSVTTQEQFLNHADDRQRGFGNNPFGNYKAPTATTREHNAGPFPGDQALYSFKLYTNSGRKAQAGTALYTCTYSFARKGSCDASWKLRDGTLIGGGAVDFDSKTYTFVITGGTGKYHGVGGTVSSSPAPGNGVTNLRLAFK
jgi:hypothetical protein